MFLRNLRIENLRSVKSVDVNFRANGKGNRKWTVLLGENGTGKTTVLRAAALVLDGSDALPALMPDPSVWVRFNSKRRGLKQHWQPSKAKHVRLVLELLMTPFLPP